MNLRTIKFKNQLWTILFCLFLIVVPLSSDGNAVTVQQVPNPRQVYGGWVSDTANILSSQTENRLNQIINDLEKETTVEIAIVTVQTTKPAQTPKIFATKLFNYWGIGKKNKNNGILFLISKAERRVEIEIGIGMEEILRDRQIINIIETKIIPQFRQNNFDRGVLDGTQALIVQVQKNNQPIPIEKLPERGDRTPIGVSPPPINKQPKQLPSSPINYLLILVFSSLIVIFSYFQLTKIYRQKFVEVIHLDPVAYDKLDIHPSQKYLNEGQNQIARKIYLRLMSIGLSYVIVLTLMPGFLELYLNLTISVSEFISLMILVQLISDIIQSIIYKKYSIPLFELVLIYVLIWVIQAPIVVIWLDLIDQQDPSTYHNLILIVGIWFSILFSFCLIGYLADFFYDRIFFTQHFLLLVFCVVSYGGFSYLILTTTLGRQNNLYIYCLLLLSFLPMVINFVRSDVKNTIGQVVSNISKLVSIVLVFLILLIISIWLLKTNNIIPDDLVTISFNIDNGRKFLSLIINPFRKLNNMLLEDLVQGKMITFSLIFISLLTANPLDLLQNK